MNGSEAVFIHLVAVQIASHTAEGMITLEERHASRQVHAVLRTHGVRFNYLISGDKPDALLDYLPREH